MVQIQLALAVMVTSSLRTVLDDEETQVPLYCHCNHFSCGTAISHGSMLDPLVPFHYILARLFDDETWNQLFLSEFGLRKEGWLD